MDRLSLLRQKNPGLAIHTVDEPLFRRYARLVESPVFAEVAAYIDRTTTVPERNTYVADVPELHTPETDAALSAFYGGLVPQIGWCNGPNFSMNGSEYHKGPELTIAITDCLMWWMLPEDLVDFDHVDSSKAEVFYIPQGCAFLLKPEILHLAPCKVDSRGYKTVIILPMGTNRPIDPELKDPAHVQQVHDHTQGLAASGEPGCAHRTPRREPQGQPHRLKRCRRSSSPA